MRLNKAIREASKKKIPYIIILGDIEQRDNTITVRTREGEHLGTMTIAQFIDLVKTQRPLC